jgi:hypothetical protein
MDHVGADGGGMDGVDPDVVRRQLERGGAHEADDAVLGGDVVADVLHAAQPGRGAGQDDRAAAAAGPDVRHGGLEGVPHAGQVDGDHVVPGRAVELLQQAVAEDARVRRHDVELAELGDAVVNRLLEGAEVTDVGLDGDDPAVERLDLAGGLGEVLRGRHRVRHGGDLAGDVDRDDVGAFGGQAHRVAAPLPAGGPGDQGDHALHASSHVR